MIAISLLRATVFSRSIWVRTVIPLNQMPDRFSSANDPDLGPDRTQFSIAHLLLVCFLIIVPLTFLYAENSGIPIGTLIVGTILVGLAICYRRNGSSILGRVFLLLLGSIIYATGTKFLVSALLQGLDDNGMEVVIPFFQSIAYCCNTAVRGLAAFRIAQIHTITKREKRGITK